MKLGGLKKFAVSLLAFASFSLVLSSCDRGGSSPGFIGMRAHLTNGEVFKGEVNFPAVQLLTLDIHPASSTATASATGGYVNVGGREVVGRLLSLSSLLDHKGDLELGLWLCKDVKPGQNIKVDYVFTGAGGTVLEQGVITLASVTGTCPG